MQATWGGGARWKRGSTLEPTRTSWGYGWFVHPSKLLWANSACRLSDAVVRASVAAPNPPPMHWPILPTPASRRTVEDARGCSGVGRGPSGEPDTSAISAGRWSVGADVEAESFLYSGDGGGPVNAVAVSALRTRSCWLVLNGIASSELGFSSPWRRSTRRE
eukprot:scaffold17023_cov32-Tisochrysis_lutea.AAC.4